MQSISRRIIESEGEDDDILRGLLYPRNPDDEVTCFDSGPKHLDRYTVVYLDRKAWGYPENYRYYPSVGMSENPFRGVGQHGECTYDPNGCNRHLGRKIKFNQLPPDCQKLVLNDLGIK